MKFRMRSIGAVVSLILIITNPKIAATGVSEGIELCLKAVLPSLFPFFIVTTYLNSMMTGHHIAGFQYFCRKLHIPVGCEFVLPLGLMGGYPVGAKLITDLYNTKNIDKRTAQILLGYCNNAGPAFILGIAGSAFASPIHSVALWLIHIGSAILTGFLLPKPCTTKAAINLTVNASLQRSVKSSINACVSVCGWIITFKILLSYLSAWFPTLIKTHIGILITGILELSNGCLSATQIENIGSRFVIYTVFFALGGLCVLLQTLSVTEPIGIGLYVHGKLIQTCISLAVAIICVKILFPDASPSLYMASILIILSTLTTVLTLHHAKKVVEFA